MAGRSAVILGASGSVGQALLAEVANCGGFGRILVLTRRPLDLQSGPHAHRAVVAAYPWLLSALLPLFAWVTPAKFRSIRTTEIAEAMVAAALHPPAQSAIYNYPEMMSLRRRRPGSY